MDNSNLKYFMYCRRSIEDKKDRKEERLVASLEDQIREMTEVADKHNLKIVKTFHETKSGKTPGMREQFNEMIRQIKLKKGNAIITWKLNRLARNLAEGGQIIEMLQTGVIKEIRTHEKVYLPSDNVLMMAVELGMANQYSIDLGADIKRGLHGRAKDGYRPSIAPIGYKNSKYREKDVKEEILVDEERFPIIRKLFDLMLTGAYSVLALARIANEELHLVMRYGKKERKLCKSNMYKILTNEFYYGYFRYPNNESGVFYKGNHKPMITKQEYDKIQKMLNRSDRPRPRTHSFAYTGLMRCNGCGACITAEEKKKFQQNGKVHTYIYYHCTKKVNANCMQKAVEEKELDKEVLGFLGKNKNTFVIS